MPEMNGMTVISRARACQRRLKVLLMSGHADVLDAAGASGIPLLAKPFKIAELRRRIAEVLLMPPAEINFSHSSARALAVSV